MGAVSCKQLLKEFDKSTVISTHRLTFKGVDGYDVYNISREFISSGKVYIAGRVEARDSEISSVRFFLKNGDYSYTVVDGIEIKKVQDPCVTYVDGDIVIGGTMIDTNPLDDEQIINYRTIFFKGKTIETLKFWFYGPDRMKDVRVFDYSKDKLLILSRPQGGKYGMGKIGYVLVDKASGIDSEVIREATLFAPHFIDGEWGGANELIRLNNGRIGVLGHIAYFDKVSDTLWIRHYHCMTFEINPDTFECSNVKIIAKRDIFEDGPYKRIDIKDVLFSGGIIREADGFARVFTGVSDCEGHMALIKDPFIEYEKK